ncbi:MAG: isoprenyl transferase [candidate division Zixibacteria bacterium]|nr:isoprenyl transferase [candidate division Zixibacteria bacterium]
MKGMLRRAVASLPRPARAAESETGLLERILSSSQPPPRHVAIIMDGNGRWAERRGLPRSVGHRSGVAAVKRVVMAADEAKIEALTLFAFSVENWGRPKREISAIMRLLYETTKRELRELADNNVRVITTGDVDALPTTRREAVLESIERTRHNTGLVLNLALNYSGRAEILGAVRQIAGKVQDGSLRLEDIDEAVFTRHLQTNGLPDPDLLIRTSGEWRLSNFLLWQTSYTELYITDTLWPDFSRADLFEAVLEYQSRERRFGRVVKSRPS